MKYGRKIFLWTHLMVQVTMVSHVRFIEKVWDVFYFDVVPTVQQFFTSGFTHPGVKFIFLVHLLRCQMLRLLRYFSLLVWIIFSLRFSLKFLSISWPLFLIKLFLLSNLSLFRCRYIQECIATASDYVNLMYKKRFGGNIAMKFDIRKAFDTVR